MERAELATVFKEAREKRGWSQWKAAAELNVDFNTVSRWENGKATPQGRNLHRICEVYGLKIEDLGLGKHITKKPVPRSGDAESFMDLTMRLLSLAFIPHRHFQDAQDAITRILEEHDMNTDNEVSTISRRDALRHLAGFPLLSLGLSSAGPVLHRPAEEIINQCAASIAACWELSKGSDDADLALAFKGASAYLPTLKALVKDSSQHRQAAASLAGQCYLLKTVLGWHLQGLKEAAQYAQQAVFYSKEAEDTPLLLATLDYLAWLHYYDRRGKQALKTILQAIPMIKEYKPPLSPRLLGGVYSTVALMQARNGQSGTATLGKAATSFYRPATGATEHYFVYMDYTQADLVLNDGMVHYHQGEHDKALDSLSQLIDGKTLKAKLVVPERTRIEGVNMMTLASLKRPKKDMEETVHFFKEGMQGSKALQSEQRYNESQAAYDIMEAVWSGEGHIKELKELVMHW